MKISFSHVNATRHNTAREHQSMEFVTVDP